MSLELRRKLVEIAKRNLGKTEVTRNQAAWIKELWPATTLGLDGYEERQPYCAAGQCWALREWLKLTEVLSALKMTSVEAEKWRCKYASVYRATNANWLFWAKKVGAKILPPDATLHTGDYVIYKRSHIEIVDDDTGIEPRFYSVGYNTSSGGFSREGEGCFRKISSRSDVLNFIRIMD